MPLASKLRSTSQTLAHSHSIAVALLLGAMFGCSVEHDVIDAHDHEDTLDVLAGQNAGRTLQGLAYAGRWQPPAAVLAIGDQQQVTFNGSPSWNGGSNCSGGATDGALTLRSHLVAFFAQIGSIGVYNCRAIDGTNSMSLHGVGRALDIMIPTVGGAADNELGDPIAHWLMMNAEAIGVQTIIWDRSIWRVSNSPRIHEYTGASPHIDHLHVELNIAAGNEDRPWFDAPFGPELCPALPAGESVIDNGDDCLRLYGPGQYWRTEAAGYSGDLAWTNAFESDTPSNWAEWALPLEVPGRYEVAVHIDPSFGVHATTRYQIHAGTQQHLVTIDQSAATGWTVLGTFDFTGANGERVTVADNTAAPVSSNQHIVVDALRIRPPPAVPPPPEEPPAEEPSPAEPPGEEPPEEPQQEDATPDGTTPDEPATDDPGPIDDQDPGLANQPAPVRITVASPGCSAAAPASPWLVALLAALSLVVRRRGRA